ncbi:MAG: AI-2E family transporter, partial [Acidobacteriota bacterium]
MKNGTLEKYFFIVLITGGLVLLGFLFRPFLGAIVLGATLAVIFYPIYRLLVPIVRFEGLAALLIVCLVLVIVFAPISFFGYRMFLEAQNVYQTLDRSVLLNRVQALRELPVFTLLPETFDISRVAQQAFSWISQNIGSVFSGAAQAVANLLLSLLALFYFVKDGGKFVAHATSLSPLTDEYDKQIVSRLHTAINSVVKGSLFIAVLQGVST